MKQKSSLGTLFCALILSACSSVAVTPVTGPDGAQNELITCHNYTTAACYEKVREICNGNYKIVNSNAFSETRYQEGAFEILVQCDSSTATAALTTAAKQVQSHSSQNGDYSQAKTYADCDQYMELAKDECREAVYKRAHAPAVKPQALPTPGQ